MDTEELFVTLDSKVFQRVEAAMEKDLTPYIFANLSLNPKLLPNMQHPKNIPDQIW